MKYQVLAVDYDGTLAKDGQVDEATIASLVRLRTSPGWHLILVTGRRLEPLLEIFPQIDLFHLVVAENGGLLYRPSSTREQPLADPPPPKFAEALRRADVPFEMGRAIIATRTPHDGKIQEVIDELGLDWEIIYNKGAVMVLPEGVDKASGLEAALEELSLSSEKTVAVGDAENDETFLNVCGLKVAVANALPALKAQADIVTQAERGAGVAELIGRLLEDGELQE